MDGLMDGWMDGWMGGWMDGWVDGWVQDPRGIIVRFDDTHTRHTTVSQTKYD